MINETGELKASDGSVLLKMWEVIVPSGSRPLVRHSHIRFEIALITGGSGVYTVGTEQYAITPGEVFVFSSNEQHFITGVGENGLRLVNLHFEPRCLRGSGFGSLSRESSGFCFRHGPDFRSCIPADRAGRIRGLFTEIAGELSDRRPEYAMQVSNLLNMMIVSLIRDYGYLEGGLPFGGNENRLILTAAEYIDGHFQDNLTLDSLARLSGLTPNYFSTLFRRVSGIRLWDYINSRRIEAAMQLLKDDRSLNIIEVAARCGFNNTANFNKVFKRTVGLTPGAYRQSDSIIM